MSKRIFSNICVLYGEAMNVQAFSFIKIQIKDNALAKGFDIESLGT